MKKRNNRKKTIEESYLNKWYYETDNARTRNAYEEKKR